MMFLKRALIALTLLAASVLPVAAQWQVANHSLPVGKGPGFVGFGAIGPAANTKLLVGGGTGADPVFATMSGDCGLVAGVVTCTSINGVSMPSSGTSGGIPYYSSSSAISSSAALTANRLVIGGGAGAAPSVLSSLGTTTTVLHGNASGAPTFAAVGSSDLSISTTSCSNQFVTAISSGGVGTCTTDTLASAQHANQGTTTTLLHGNAAGNPSWGQVAIGSDVSGLGTNVATALATPSGTNLAAAFTDETGSGVPVFATNPTITSPSFATSFGLSGVSPVFVPGPTSATAGSTQAIDWLWGTSADRTSAINEAGIWSGKVFSGVGVARSFDASTNSVSAALGPNAALFSLARAAGTNNDVVSVLGSSDATTNNSVVFGANFIARTESALTGVKLVGMEVDVEPASGVTPAAGSIGIPINVFNSAVPGPAIQVGTVGGGTFQNGIILDGIASTGTGLGPNGSAAMDSLWNCGSGTYTTACGLLPNTQKLRFSGTASNHAYLYNDSSNNLRIVGAGTATLIRNNADSTTNWSIDDAGAITATNRAQINGGATDNVSLGVRQTSAGSPTADVFGVYNNNGSTKYFSIDPNGSAVHNAKASTDLSVVYNVTTAGQTAQFLLRDAGTDKWAIRKTSGNQLDIFSNVLSGAVLQANDTGLVDVKGSLGRGAPVTLTGNGSVGAGQSWIINNKSGSALTLTLPTASSFTGREIMVKTIQAQAVNSASSNVVPITGGAASTAILTGTSGKWATLVSDGTNWIIMEAN
jgi:hypothetical protein